MKGSEKTPSVVFGGKYLEEKRFQLAESAAKSLLEECAYQGIVLSEYDVELSIKKANDMQSEQIVEVTKAESSMEPLDEKSNLVLEKIRVIASAASTWANISTAILDPQIGIIPLTFCTENEYKEFLKSKQYEEIKAILEGLMNKFGITTNVKPIDTGNPGKASRVVGAAAVLFARVCGFNAENEIMKSRGWPLAFGKTAYDKEVDNFFAAIDPENKK